MPYSKTVLQLTSRSQRLLNSCTVQSCSARVLYLCMVLGKQPQQAAMLQLWGPLLEVGCQACCCCQLWRRHCTLADGSLPFMRHNINLLPKNMLSDFLVLMPNFKLCHLEIDAQVRVKHPG